MKAIIFVRPKRLSGGQRSNPFQYTDADGDATDYANPNGSVGHIAGICNDSRNVAGMMPHPERAAEPALNETTGRLIFESLINAQTTSASV